VRYLAHWIHLDDTIHVDAEGDAWFVSTQDGATRTSEGQLYVEAVERIAAEQHRPVVVTSLVAVAA
jgi:hypothetical protein